ncbi:hypothetical protein EF912_32860 [Streptomyces sp. WAC07061]|uniref:hypothetical protein n=1 Tax=Streptomyces sp. WAC07061 TaxID=2487410 RepID=UPI000F7B45A5|nr:hypothetical protein [Streptomyces sp. WAC07061]RSS39769.1 hypothetical protein EF912_32860 [Streptomyces sp. WAC07061]
MLEFLARNTFLRPLCTVVGLVSALTMATSQPDHHTLWTVSAVLAGLDLTLQGYTALLGRRKAAA